MKSPRRILLIEDNITIANLSRMILQHDGHEVLVAANVNEGIAMAVQYRPAVIFCDLCLNETFDGCHVARALRSDPVTRDTPIFAVTAYRLEDCEQRALKAGFSMVLTKPVDYENIEEFLEQIKVDREVGAVPGLVVPRDAETARGTSGIHSDTEAV